MVSQTPRKQSIQTRAWALFALASAATTGQASAQVVVDSLGSNGELSFADPGAGPDAAYHVEWSNDLEGWRRDWSDLSFLRTGGEPATVDVPMFYRVVAAPSAGSIPSPVEDTDYRDGGNPDPGLVELGRLLFFDKVLSGNQNTSCATCHHPMAGTGDGLSLSIGEGGQGLGVLRTTGDGADAVHERVPRNAPALFNVGAREFEVMFHDGRLAADVGSPGGFLSPAGEALPEGLNSALAAQAMFPVTSGTEMAGQPGENTPVADDAASGDLEAIWEALAARLRGIPEYVDLFTSTFEGISEGADITFVHAANAIAAFEADAWRADNSAFDQFLRGDTTALGASARRGMELFYGKADCARCHSGKFQTDHGFHAIAMPQIGPGKGDGESGHEDFGLERVTGDSADRFKFRTPSLRNVALTAPYGHSGAYNSLEAVVRHHLNPGAALEAYTLTDHAVLPARPDLDAGDGAVLETRGLEGDADRWAPLAAASELAPLALDDADVGDLLAFLRSLTDEASIDLRRDVPPSLPSGLPAFD